MKFYYDFHIHSALSPCADNDNTPLNIVNMSVLKGLDAIAVTDHNSVKNCRAAIIAGQSKGLLVLPGMELTTSEDIHLLCLFAELKQAQEFENYIRKDMLIIKNNIKIFGNQFIYDEFDNLIGEQENYLSVATNVPSYKAADILNGFGGIAIPAHINREANGIISILGGLDKSMNFTALELTKSNENDEIFYGNDYKIIKNSDAHNLGAISEAENFLDLPALNADKIIELLKTV